MALLRVGRTGGAGARRHASGPSSRGVDPEDQVIDLRDHGGTETTGSATEAGGRAEHGAATTERARDTARRSELGGALVRWAGCAAVALVLTGAVAVIWSVPVVPALVTAAGIAVILALVAGRRRRLNAAEPAGDRRRDERDVATGVLSRAGLVHDLNGRTSGDGRNGMALLFLRLDRLDVLNERLGRAGADQVLRSLAGRLQDAAGPTCTVARLSSASFVVVRSDLEGAERWARVVCARAGQASLDSGPEVHLSFASALVTTDGFHQDAELLVAEAEVVARRSFDRGSLDLAVVRLGLDPVPTGHTDLAARVEQAVRDGEIRPLYQPIIDLRSMEVVGVEALARWPEAPSGVEGPEAFLEVVGVLGLRAQVFDQILEQVCQDFASEVIQERGWWVSVNIGVEECSDQTLPGRIAAKLAESGLAPDRLVLEVSERVIPDPAVERALRIIGDLEVRLAIDDFGSGWSSFAQIRSLPIELVKLDRTLISSQTVRDVQVTSAIIGLARALGLRTLAEGVETGEELLNLCIADCDYGQGYWWSKATTLADLLDAFPVREEDASAFGTVFSLRPEESDQEVEPSSDEFDMAEVTLAPVVPLAGVRADLGPVDDLVGDGVLADETGWGERWSWLSLADDALLDRLRVVCGPRAHLGVVRGTEP